MSSRSLKASPEGAEHARLALAQKAWTQQVLSDKLAVSRQTVVKFFNGKPIDRRTFAQICQLLDLPLEDILFAEGVESNAIDPSLNSMRLKNSIPVNSGRSLAVSQQGRKIAQRKLKELCLTQTTLAEKLMISRQPVNKFFNGKPIDRRYFMEICEYLGLDLESVVFKTSENTFDIDSLVEDIRHKVFSDIQERCGSMRILDMTQPVSIEDIYTDVNVLEKISGHRRFDISEMNQEFEQHSFDRFSLGRIGEQRIPGLEAISRYSKIMILGKPGSGKTTFLKRLATLCNQGKFESHRVPIFITLKDFSEANENPTLLTYISQQWFACGIEDRKIVEALLNKGRALVLLDGLDEVRATNHRRVIREIQGMSSRFRECQFGITCRISAQDYTFEKFTEVEVADFNQQQVFSFSRRWFLSKNDPVKAESFIYKLRENEPIQELAKTPLLLTLLCLVFEEAFGFPYNRSELYREGLDILLKKWDAARNIERDQVYKKLSLKGKQDLLSSIAFQTFSNNEYFFRRRTVSRYIVDYIRNLPLSKSDDVDALQLDSSAVLKSIEAQHGLLVEQAKGIYSFSHLTFQEYFTATKIVDSSASQTKKALQQLVSHLSEKRWRDVFLLVSEMLSLSDTFLSLIADKINTQLEGDKTLQELIGWVDEKASLTEMPYKPAAVRAFYLHLIRPFEFSGALNLACTIDLNLNLDLNRNSFLRQAWKCIEDEFFGSNNNHEKLLKETNSRYLRELGSFVIEFRDFSHGWELSQSQKGKLQTYVYANNLLVDCLNSDSYITRCVREEIETMMLRFVRKPQRSS